MKLTKATENINDNKIFRIHGYNLLIRDEEFRFKTRIIIRIIDNEIKREK